jgi:hypothetical protein
VRTVGYALLHRRFNLPVFEPRLPARTDAVLRVIAQKDHLAIPESVAPADEASTLEHVLFALKHEGIDLQILSCVLPLISAEELLLAIRGKPGGVYLRKACYLWEHFTKQDILDAPAVTGAVNPLFEPESYLTCEGPNNKRWRIQFNGFGSLDHCPTVRRTDTLVAALAGDLFKRVRDFADSTDPGVLDRAMSWAYLDETHGSFAIEREAATPSKSERFVQLLRRAHEARPVDEAYLVELQNATIDNPLDQAVQFRIEQNRLVNGRTVSYVPPPPEIAADLMQHMMRLANEAPKLTNPVVAATLSSFGFVFIHPFMDGNGRISRFLFHKALCDSGQLPDGLLLPVSVAMKKHEKDYLSALQSYSKQARQCWQVGVLGGGQFDETFLATDAIYRYWDATQCVEFGFAMAEEALEHHLYSEVRLLQVYDQVKRVVEADVDVRGETLSTLIFACIENGRISNNLRKKFEASVPAGLLDRIEALVAEANDGAGPAEPLPDAVPIPA